MFLEGFGSASIVNGVLRIETFHRNATGADIGSGELLIPVGRVIPVAEALNALIGRIQEQEKVQNAAAAEAVAV